MAVVYKYRVIGQTQLQLPADVKIIYFASLLLSQIGRAHV